MQKFERRRKEGIMRNIWAVAMKFCITKRVSIMTSSMTIELRKFWSWRKEIGKKKDFLKKWTGGCEISYYEIGYKEVLRITLSKINVSLDLRIWRNFGSSASNRSERKREEVEIWKNSRKREWMNYWRSGLIAWNFTPRSPLQKNS